MPPGAGALQVRAALARAPSGGGPAVVPYAADSAPGRPAGVRRRRPPRTASRSSSAPRAPPAPPSARCSPPRRCGRRRGPPTSALGGPGQWLLAMPAHHVAGLQVLVRSVVGRHRAQGRRHSPPASPSTRFAAATAGLDAGGPRAATPRWSPPSWSACSTTPRGRAALQRFDAVLLGGAASAVRPAGRGRGRGGVRVADDVRHERDRRRLRLRRGAARVQPRSASTTTGASSSAAPPSPRATSARPDLTAAAFAVDADGRAVVPHRRPGPRSTTTAGWYVDGRARRPHQHRRAQGRAAPGRGRAAQPRARRQRGGGRGHARPGVGPGRRARWSSLRRGRRRTLDAAATCGRPCAASCPATRCPAGCWSLASIPQRGPGKPDRRGSVASSLGAPRRSSYDTGLKEDGCCGCCPSLRACSR